MFIRNIQEKLGAEKAGALQHSANGYAALAAEALDLSIVEEESAAAEEIPFQHHWEAEFNSRNSNGQVCNCTQCNEYRTAKDQHVASEERKRLFKLEAVAKGLVVEDLRSAALTARRMGMQSLRTVFPELAIFLSSDGTGNAAEDLSKLAILDITQSLNSRRMKKQRQVAAAARNSAKDILLYFGVADVAKFEAAVELAGQQHDLSEIFQQLTFRDFVAFLVTEAKSGALVDHRDSASSTKKFFYVGRKVTGTGMPALRGTPDGAVTQTKGGFTWLMCSLLDEESGPLVAMTSAEEDKDIERLQKLDKATHTEVEIAQAAEEAASIAAKDRCGAISKDTAPSSFGAYEAGVNIMKAVFGLYKDLKEHDDAKKDREAFLARMSQRGGTSTRGETSSQQQAYLQWTKQIDDHLKQLQWRQAIPPNFPDAAPANAKRWVTALRALVQRDKQRAAANDIQLPKVIQDALAMSGGQTECGACGVKDGSLKLVGLTCMCNRLVCGRCLENAKRSASYGGKMIPCPCCGGKNDCFGVPSFQQPKLEILLEPVSDGRRRTPASVVRVFEQLFNKDVRERPGGHYGSQDRKTALPKSVKIKAVIAVDNNFDRSRFDGMVADLDERERKNPTDTKFLVENLPDDSHNVRGLATGGAGSQTKRGKSSPGGASRAGVLDIIPDWMVDGGHRGIPAKTTLTDVAIADMQAKGWLAQHPALSDLGKRRPASQKWLFHGTSWNAVRGIAQSQFREAEVTAYGKGVYFAEEVYKSDDYTDRDDGLDLVPEDLRELFHFGHVRDARQRRMEPAAGALPTGRGRARFMLISLVNVGRKVKDRRGTGRRWCWVQNPMENPMEREDGEPHGEPHGEPREKMQNPMENPPHKNNLHPIPFFSDSSKFNIPSSTTYPKIQAPPSATAAGRSKVSTAF